MTAAFFPWLIKAPANEFPLNFQIVKYQLAKDVSRPSVFSLEGTQHKACLTFPMFWITPAEEHRGYSQPPLPPALRCTDLKSRFWKACNIHMPCWMRVGGITPFLAPMCSPFHWFANSSARLQKAGISFPLHTCSPFLSPTEFLPREGLSRTFF